MLGLGKAALFSPNKEDELFRKIWEVPAGRDGLAGDE